ncbi:MAG TPA: glycoside hydrolase family 27 protein, partial [Pyrinomonadaceae bacterium]|nr:glycoside hydrolase family 27 protein [Pyrinomonadaceae bacterium]
YLTMRDAIYAAGRQMVLSICEWGTDKPWEWGKKIGHLWRTTGDIYACFDCVKDHGTWKSWGAMKILDMQKGLREHAGPGHWNDPDMLEVGNGMSAGEDRAHFSMWAMLAAPLIAGNDLRNMTKETRDILTNREVIAVNQDPLGVQGFQYSVKDKVEVWFKPLAGSDWAMAVLNRGESPHEFSFDWKNEQVGDTFAKRAARFDLTEYAVRDLWSGRDLGTTRRALSATVPPHDILMLRLKKM